MTSFWQLPATTLAELIRTGQAGAVEVARDAIGHVERTNGPLNAIVDFRPEEVLRAAEVVDRLAPEERARLPLAGVPVTIKVTADQRGHATTHGLASNRDTIAAYDAPAVQHLQRAGAVVLGRTNTPAFSYRWFTSNRIHGRTRNPVCPELTPGGSSGGASAAVASGMGAIAHGTDIAGSVRYPAYACGVHGLRPTPGRVPAYNETSPSRPVGQQMMGVTGPLARTVADIELALSVMSQEHVDDPLWVPAPLEGPRLPRRAAVCVAPDGLETAREVRQALLKAAEALRAAGWQVEEMPTLPPLREASDLHVYLWMGDGHQAKLEKALAEGDAGAIQALQGQARRVAQMTVRDFGHALTRRLELMRSWQRFLADWPVVLLPVSSELPFPDDLDLQGEAGYERVWEAQIPLIGTAFVGLPGLALNTGRAGRVPVGIQIISSRFREDMCLQAARDIEQTGDQQQAGSSHPADINQQPFGSSL